jgi:type IV pilus assembly protein PilM
LGPVRAIQGTAPPLKGGRRATDSYIMLKSRRRQEKTIVGLEMDPSHLAVAQVDAKGGVSVAKGAVAELRPGILRDGEVADPAALTEELRKLFADNDLPTTVRLGVANQRIIVRTLDVPVVEDPQALEEAVRAVAPDHIPVPMDEAVLDFQPLGVVDTADGPRNRVVIVAVRREMIDRLVASATEAGLTIAGIDLSAFAMVRALRAYGTEHAVLYINLAGLTNVAVANDSGCLFTRAATGGLDTMVNGLSERRGLTLEHARGWLQHVGLVTPLAEIEGDSELVAAVRQTLEDGVHQVADTVRNSLNFYRMQDAAETVERAVLTGPALAIPGFAEALADQLNMPVEAAVVAGAGDIDARRLTVAAGLAVDDTP